MAPSPVTLVGNQIPNINLPDLNKTVLFGQTIVLMPSDFSNSPSVQAAISKGTLLVINPAPPMAGATAGTSSIDPITFTLRPASVAMGNLGPDVTSQIGSSTNWFWITDPNFAYNTSTNVLSWGNGSLIFQGGSTTISTSNTTATSSSLIIGTIVTGVCTPNLRATTYTPASNEIILGTVDFTNKSIHIANSGGMEADDVSYNPTGTSFVSTSAQTAFTEVDNWLKGSVTYPSTVNFKSTGPVNITSNNLAAPYIQLLSTSWQIGNFNETTQSIVESGNGLALSTGNTLVIRAAAGSGTLITNGGVTGRTVLATLHNDGSTAITHIDITDKPTGGSIGTRQTTVDIGTSFRCNQATAGQTLTIPNPLNTLEDRVAYVTNVGTASFTMLGETISPSTGLTALWNGSTWVADGTFTNGGNSFGATATLGTLDNNALNLTTNNTTRFTLQAAGNLVPASDNTLAIGSSSARLFNLYTTNLNSGSSGLLVQTGVGLVVSFGGGNPATAGNGLAIGTFGTNAKATFQNGGSTTFSPVAVANLATGGNIGTAATTVDVSTTFNVNQTTAGQAVTLPNPTDTSTTHYVVVNNIGTASFTMYGVAVNTNQTIIFAWNGTAWGVDAPYTNLLSLNNTWSGFNTFSGTSFTANPSGAVSISGQLITINNTGTGANVLNLQSSSSINLNPTTYTFSNGARVIGTTAISNLATGGNIGTAATTVDVAESFTINQTTAAQTITLPSPTNTITGRVVYIMNIGSTSFTMLTKTVSTGSGLTAMWNGTAWAVVGTGG